MPIENMLNYTIGSFTSTVYTVHLNPSRFLSKQVTAISHWIHNIACVLKVVRTNGENRMNQLKHDEKWLLVPY